MYNALCCHPLCMKSPWISMKTPLLQLLNVKIYVCFDLHTAYSTFCVFFPRGWINAGPSQPTKHPDSVSLCLYNLLYRHNWFQLLVTDFLFPPNLSVWHFEKGKTTEAHTAYIANAGINGILCAVGYPALIRMGQKKNALSDLFLFHPSLDCKYHIQAVSEKTSKLPLAPSKCCHPVTRPSFRNRPATAPAWMLPSFKHKHPPHTHTHLPTTRYCGIDVNSAPLWPPSVWFVDL